MSAPQPKEEWLGESWHRRDDDSWERTISFGIVELGKGKVTITREIKSVLPPETQP